MKKRYFVLLFAATVAWFSLAKIDTTKSPEAEGIIAQARVTRHRNNAKETLENADARVQVEPKEKVSVELKLHKARNNVRVEAPNGGWINGGKEALKAARVEQHQILSFDYEPGAAPGRYTLEVSEGKDTKTLEFWVGAEPPQGKAGPDLKFTGTSN